MSQVSASVLGADLLHLGDEIRRMEACGVRWLHLDHMDGHFVPNISFGPDFVAAIRRHTDMFLDVHLMFSNPMQYIRTYAKAGAQMLTVHYECEDDVPQMLTLIRELGMQAGLSIKPATPPDAIAHLLPLCDLVLVMTVEPGFGGQSLREDCVAKLPVLRRMIQQAGLNTLLEVDGGVKASNAARVVDAGADVLVIGTGIFGAQDPSAVVQAVAQAGHGA